MASFPLDQIEPLEAEMFGVSSNISLNIPLKPFSLDDLEVETCIRLDGIDLPTLDLDKLEHQAFRFPTNPNDGYIDGSIYIEHAHHPVDVTEILFGAAINGSISAKISANFVFSYEGLREYKDVSAVLHVNVQKRDG